MFERKKRPSCIVNLFGGRGTGKTTLAAGLFYRMKSSGMRAHLVLDILPGMSQLERGLLATYDVHSRAMRMRALAEDAEFVVTNNPLPNALLARPDTASFEGYLLELFSGFRNVNIFVRGRDEDDAVNGSEEIKNILLSRNIPCVVFGAGFPDPCAKAPERMMNTVLALRDEVGTFGLHRDTLASGVQDISSRVIPFPSPANAKTKEADAPVKTPVFRLARAEA